MHTITKSTSDPRFPVTQQEETRTYINFSIGLFGNQPQEYPNEQIKSLPTTRTNIQHYFKLLTTCLEPCYRIFFTKSNNVIQPQEEEEEIEIMNTQIFSQQQQPTVSKTTQQQPTKKVPPLDPSRPIKIATLTRLSVHRSPRIFPETVGEDYAQLSDAYDCNCVFSSKHEIIDVIPSTNLVLSRGGYDDNNKMLIPMSREGVSISGSLDGNLLTIITGTGILQLFDITVQPWHLIDEIQIANVVHTSTDPGLMLFRVRFVSNEIIFVSQVIQHTLPERKYDQVAIQATGSITVIAIVKNHLEIMSQTHSHPYPLLHLFQIQSTTGKICVRGNVKRNTLCLNIFNSFKDLLCMNISNQILMEPPTETPEELILFAWCLHDDCILCAIPKDEDNARVANAGSLLQIINIEANQVIHRVNSPYITNMTVSPNSRLLACCTIASGFNGGHSIVLWSLPELVQLSTLELGSRAGLVGHLSFSPPFGDALSVTVIHEEVWAHRGYVPHMFDVVFRVEMDW
jgi:hypothetical protein